MKIRYYLISYYFNASKLFAITINNNDNKINNGGTIEPAWLQGVNSNAPFAILPI